MSKRNYATVIVCAAFIILAFYDVTAFVDSSRRGLLLFGNNVLPVLFPFFFVSSLLVELDLFRRRGARLGVVMMSILSGYPTSARMLSELYARGQITRQQAIRTATYTSTASPIFVIATVGVSLYGDVRLGVIVFVAHLAGAMVNGLIYCGVGGKNPVAPWSLRGFKEPEATPWGNHPASLREAPLHKGGELATAISKALYNSVQNILAVGGLVVIFFVASAPFGVYVSALLEMTGGVFHASQSGVGGVWRAVIPCAIVSFGGLCVAVQAAVFFRAFALPMWFYALYKATHAVLAVIICIILGSIF